MLCVSHVQLIVSFHCQTVSRISLLLHVPGSFLLGASHCGVPVIGARACACVGMFLTLCPGAWEVTWKHFDPSEGCSLPHYPRSKAKCFHCVHVLSEIILSCGNESTAGNVGILPTS